MRTEPRPVWGQYGRMSSITLRLLTLDDSPVLAELLRVNRDFLTPWEPIRGEEYFTVDGQHANIRDALERHGHGSALPLAILDDAARVIGRITLDGIARDQAACSGWSLSGAASLFLLTVGSVQASRTGRGTSAASPGGGGPWTGTAEGMW